MRQLLFRVFAVALLAAGLAIGVLAARARGASSETALRDALKALSADAEATVKPATDVAADDMILDIGPRTARQLAGRIAAAGTVVWNGPVGVFEIAQFAKGTEVLAQAIADSKAFSIAGGGDTVAAINQFGIAGRIGYISTAGGAFLEFLEGKTLPAVAALEARA